MYRIILPLAVFALLAFAAGHPGAVAADDQELGGDLQPLVPLTQVRLFNFQNYGHNGNFALSPDGKTLAMPQGNGFMLYNLTKSTNPYQYQQPRFVMLEGVNLYNSPMAFAPDGKTVVVASPRIRRTPAYASWIWIRARKSVRSIMISPSLAWPFRPTARCWL